MDFNAQYRLRSASAPVPVDILLNPSLRVMYQSPVAVNAHAGLHLSIPCSPHVFVDYSSVPFHQVQSFPSSPNVAPSPQQHRPHFPSASASYPVLPVNAHKSSSGGGFREATLHTKNPLADNTTQRRKNRPKLHLFASRKSNTADHATEQFPEPPVEWLVGESSTPSIETSPVSSHVASENGSEDESDFGTSPVPFEYYSSSESENGLDSSSAACRDLSIGLKALLKVQA